MQAIYAKAKRIRLAVFDVDGVLTDGTLYLTDSGEEIKAFNSLDGHGMKMLRESGVQLAIITGRTSRSVELRAKNLGIELVFQGVADKAVALATLLGQSALEAAAIAYMGDDVVDLPVLRRCGLALTVPAAPLLVKQHADYVTQAHGGHGAAREVCELIMHAQGTLEPALAAFLK
ncbi:MAG TPA: HAD family hydrolase [Burkholderiales bacterium]|jgi:3-deoxy-D-manno-octulosonate 8-phosphate phosphatase (KDO 8-P phosphatase)|nr:HAD family hydrolase [Burkholderiales bacterium]